MDPGRPPLPRLTTNLSPRERHSVTSRPTQESVPAKRTDTPVPPHEGDVENIPLLTGFCYGMPTKPLVAKVESPVARAKTLYYEDAFAVRNSRNSPQERVSRSSVVVAELKTNIESKLESSKLAYDLAFHLAQIYQRPESNIMVTIQQDVCLFFDACLPSYLLKIYALPSLIAPMTNMRHTDLIQGALYDLIRITADHGVVIFLPIPEENLGMNGTTARGEIHRLERERADQGDNPGIFKSLSRRMSRRLKSSSGNSAPMSPLSAEITDTTAAQPNVNVPTPAEWAEDERGRRLSQLGRRGSLKSNVRRKLFDAIASNKERDNQTKEEQAKEDKSKGDKSKEGPSGNPR